MELYIQVAVEVVGLLLDLGQDMTVLVVQEEIMVVEEVVE